VKGNLTDAEREIADKAYREGVIDRIKIIEVEDYHGG
jgi:hypothetical protein